MAVNGTDIQLAAACSAAAASSAPPSGHRYAPAYRNSTVMLNQQELSRLQAGNSPRPAPCVRELNAGSTPVQRAIIALESSDKSRPPMPTERIKA
jgi:hypothetical protein